MSVDEPRKPEVIEAEYNAAKKLSDAHEAKQKKIADEWRTAVSALREQLAAAEAPFQARMEADRKAQRKDEQKTYDLDKELIASKTYYAQQNALKVGKFDAESFRAFLVHKQLFDADRPWRLKIELKDTLENGIMVFKETDDFDPPSYRKYWFVRGTEVVAFWKRRTAEHQGDTCLSRAWVGSGKLNAENEISAPYDYETRHKSPFYRKTSSYGSRCDPSIKEFMAYVEKMNVKSLKVIDLSDEKTADILSNMGYD